MPEMKNPDRYGQIDQKIVDELMVYENSYFREDTPIPFLEGLTIYPIAVKDYEAFASCSICFSLNKNEDPKGVAVSHLDYLLNKIDLPDHEGQMWLMKIIKLMTMVFHLELGYLCKDCGKVLSYKSEEVSKYMSECKTYVETITQNPDLYASTPEPKLICPNCGKDVFEETFQIKVDEQTKKKRLFLNGQEIKKQDFNRLRQIVLFQNFPDYADETWIDPAVKKDHDERLRIEQQKNDVHATIEKKVICLSVTTNYKLSEIWNMSIRHFTMALSTVDDLINYKLLKQAKYSGLSGFPKDFKIDHWIYKPNRDIYGDSYKDVDQITNEINRI